MARTSGFKPHRLNLQDLGYRESGMEWRSTSILRSGCRTKVRACIARSERGFLFGKPVVGKHGPRTVI